MGHLSIEAMAGPPRFQFIDTKISQHLAIDLNGGSHALSGELLEFLHRGRVGENLQFLECQSAMPEPIQCLMAPATVGFGKKAYVQPV